MFSAFIRKGHGYENHSTEGRCTAFDGLDIIAAPLPGFDQAGRDSRSWPGKDGPGVTTASHVVALGKAQKGGPGLPGDLFIMMHNGSGREVLRVGRFYDGGDLEAAILAMPERVQYALLYSIWSTANAARNEAAATSDQKWASAIASKRIRQKRKGDRVAVEIIPEWEKKMSDARKAAKQSLA